jgi:hypothetical protein
MTKKIIKTATKTGFNQESKTIPIKVAQLMAPGKISRNLKSALSFAFFKSEARPTLR